MPSFLKRIKTEQGSLNFYFNLLASSGGLHFLVSVVGRDQKTYLFQMQQENGKWIMAMHLKACSRWIMALEKEYSCAIWEQLHLEYISAARSPLWESAIYNNPSLRAAVLHTSNNRSTP